MQTIAQSYRTRISGDNVGVRSQWEPESLSSVSRKKFTLGASNAAIVRRDEEAVPPHIREQEKESPRLDQLELGPL